MNEELSIDLFEQKNKNKDLFVEFKLLRAYDLIKDQSFFLCHLKNSVLPFIEFPIGNMMKSDVKRLANEMNLERIARKNESNLLIGFFFNSNFICFYPPKKKRYGFMFYW